MESTDAATSNNKMGTPPKHKTMKKGTKPLTPTSNKKRKNKMATTPTDEKSLEKYSKKAKETLNVIKPGNEEQKERDARHKVVDNCKTFKLEVSNSMWAWLSKMMYSEKEKKIHLLRTQANHNTVSPSLSNEITNNLLGNIVGADLSSKIHDRGMGNDMKCILTYNTKASIPLFLFFLHLVKKNQKNIYKL